MTRRAVLLAVAAAFTAGLFLGLTVRAAQAPRSAPVIPAATPMGVSREPDLARTGAPAPSLLPEPAASLSPAARPSDGTSPKESGPAHPAVRGIASTYGPGWDGWTALPQGPGTQAVVCGPAACVTVTANDAGPSRAMQRAGRSVDLDVRTFQTVCGCSWRRGLVAVTVELVP